jgi:Calx-beta domain
VEFFDGTNSLGVVRNPIAILDTTPVRLPGLDTDVLTENSLTRPFVLAWTNVPPGKHVLTAVATDNAGDSSRSRPITIAVREPGDLPVVRIMATDAVAREGTSNTATFRIRRTGPTNSALTVFYAIRGTASNGVDYVTIPNSLTIPAGRHGARILITPIDDKLPERIETVLLRLTQPPFDPPSTYEIGWPARAGAVILDNDHALLSPEPLAGALHLRLGVFEGMAFRLESSTDLVNWEEEASAIADEDGVSVVEETGEQLHRYFRVVPEYGELDDD